MACFSQQEGQLGDALPWLKQAVELKPDDAAYWEYLAELHAEREESAEALPCWEQVLQLEPERAGAHVGLGWALQEEQRMTEAAEHFRAALSNHCHEGMPMTRFFFPSGRAGAALALTMLFELCLFADSHYRRWEEVIAPLNQPAANQGEGLVIRGNGLGYYAWLRSLLIDHDWDFANEFDDHPVAGDYVPPASYKTELGRRANQWSVGPACIWAIFVVPGHYVLLALGDWSPWAADGYSLPYQLLVGAASLTTSYAGLLFLYHICLQYARPSRAALSAILLTLGSTLIYYGTIEVSMAHGIAAAVLAGFVWYWLKTYGSMRWSRWLCVGLCLGAACLMRWQLATFAVLPAGEVLFLTVRTRDNLGKRLAGLTLSAFGAFIAFVPQMVAWRCVYGHWLVEPIPQLAHHWLSPALWDVLLSQDRSLFYWTPICALALLGYFLGRPNAYAEPMSLLLVAFGLQIYALASVWGQGLQLDNVGNFAGAFLSRAYGMRHLTENIIALVPGLAILLERSSGTRFRLVFGLGFFLALWNLLLISQYVEGLLPEIAGMDPQTLSKATLRFVAAKPWLVIVLTEVLGLVCMVLLWRQAEPAINSRDPTEVPRRAFSPTADLLRWGTLALLLGGVLTSALTQTLSVGFFHRVYRDLDGSDVHYAVFVPHDYRPHRAYPVLLNLHGSGVRTLDTTGPPREPLAAAIREREATFDMIVVFPRSQSRTWEVNSPDLDRPLRILGEIGKSYHVDEDRIFLTGISAGAFGVWNLAATHPEKWAAIVPICGGGDPEDARKIRHIPCWCFHGAQDNVISVEESRRMIQALRMAGANPRYDEYPDVGHNCWDKAYRTPELFAWLRSQKRSH